MMRLVAATFAVAFAICAFILIPPPGQWFGSGSTLPDNQVTVTRAATDGALDAVADAAAPAIATDAITLDATVAGIVAGLDGAGAATPFEAAVVAALGDGLSDQDIDSELFAGAVAGTYAVPAELVTADGRIDTQRLLAAVEAAARATGQD